MRAGIEEKFPTTIAYLDKIPHRSWALYALEAAGAKTYMQRTSNYVESTNSALKDVRAEAPLKAIEKFINKLVDMAAEAAAEAESMVSKGQILTNFALTEYKTLETAAAGCTVQRTSSPTQAYVQSVCTRDSPERLVDFNNKTCSCLEWQQNGRPCHHAIACNCYKQGVLGLELRVDGRWWRFAWDDIYLADVYHAAVTGVGVIKPQRLNLIPDGTTKVPAVAKQRGRPKVKRMRRAGEGGRPPRKRAEFTCSECGGTGHTRATCVNPRAAIDLTVE